MDSALLTDCSRREELAKFTAKVWDYRCTASIVFARGCVGDFDVLPGSLCEGLPTPHEIRPQVSRNVPEREDLTVAKDDAVGRPAPNTRDMSVPLQAGGG